MRKFILTTVIALVALVGATDAAAQYYNTGQSPASTRWGTIGNDSLRMIFPLPYEHHARSVLFYMDSVRNDISYGFSHGPLRTPVVFHTENFLSNGLAMLAPRRIEMMGIPAISTYSEPWLKQLATHEFRHMVQYGNINRNTTKVLGWFFGQQAPLLATGLLPFWFIEGDAVMAETQFSSFGRGLQPSFTMHYRALGDEILESKNPDKWFCGSYRDYVPSHYELGYQLVSYADRTYDEYIGDRLADYTSRYPIFIFTTQLALKKYFGTSTRKLFRETFAELNALWDSLPDNGNSPRVVVPPVKTYTTYSYPLYLDDNTLLALKSDYDQPTRFVSIDLTTGEEKRLFHTGIVSSRPVMRDGVIMWTEYRQSMFWEQKVESRLCRAYVGADRYDVLDYVGDNILYPVPVSRDATAWVRYDYRGSYTVEYSPAAGGKMKYGFPEDVSIHGLAWDNISECFYFIALSDDGMWIGGLDFSGERAEQFHVTEPARITIGDLSAADGMLYFNSIYSGKDEVHAIDLATGEEHRISDSRYGSFSPSPSPDGVTVAVTTYERDGYKAAVQEVEYWEEVEPQTQYPRNTVNAPLKIWDVPCIDDIMFDEQAAETSTEKYARRKYSKAAHLFDLHSWAPLYYVPDELLSDYSFETHFGATIISQSLLNDMESSLSYGYLLDGHSKVKANVKYYGWAPKIEVSAMWSDRGHLFQQQGIMGTATSLRGNTFNLSARAYLPILLSTGYNIRSLVPQVQYVFNNSEILPIGASETERMSVFLGTLQYSDNVRTARLDLQPRWGYTLRTTAGTNPFSSITSTAISFYGKAYTPGFMPHHGFSLAAAYQHNTNKTSLINVIDFQPQGYQTIYPLNYFALAAHYVMPVAYPDWGLSGVFFLKRISLDVGFEYARYTTPKSQRYVIHIGGPQRLENYGTVINYINTVGGRVMLDITPFRMPSQATTTLSVGFYKPRSLPFYVTFGFSVPL